MPLFLKTISRTVALRFLLALLLVMGINWSAAPTAAAQESVSIVVTPSTQTVAVGDTLFVTVEMQAGSTEVNAADVDLTFDPNVLRFEDIDNGSTFGLVLTSSGNNTTGTINYVAAAFGTTASGTFDLFTVEFTALATTDAAGTALAFSPETSVANIGQPVDASTVDGTVVIPAANQAPVADDQNVSTDEDTPVGITLTASDVNDDSLTYQVVAGPSDGVLSGAAPNLTYTPNDNFNGSDSFTFQANDGQADSNVATVDIIVNDINDAPAADAGADQTLTDADNSGSEDVTLDGTGSMDGDGTIDSYVWTENGAQIATGANPSVNFAVGTHDVTLTVTDDDGATDTDSVTIIVNAADNVAPEADAGANQTVTDGDGNGSEDVTLDGTGSMDDDGTIDSYTWTENGAQIATGANPTVILAVGLHEITLTVTDNDGASDTDSVTIFVNAPPVADAGEDQAVTDSDDSGSETITLNGTGSTDDTGLASYAWSENGSPIASGPTPSVDLAVGTHNITLTVTDDNGATDSDSVTIVVDAAVSAEVVLVIDPETTNTVIGQQFTVDIVVQAGEQQVDGAAAYVNFDPSLLQVAEVTPGDTLDLQLRNDVDNGAGELSLAYGTVSDFPSGTFVLATVTFDATGATTGTPLNFNTQRPRKTNATFGGQSVLDSTEPGTVVIESASLTGSVILEGRDDPPSSKWIVPLTVEFYTPGTDTLVQSYTPTTDNSGDFVLAGVFPGTYDIAVKNSHTLQNVVTNVVIVSGTGNQVDLGTLREGDANNDNFVDLVDFSVVSSNFSLCQGAANFDERADFNEDGCIDLIDFSLLTNHFDEAGDTVPASGAQAAASTQRAPAYVGGAKLAAAVSGSQAAVGEELAVTLHVAAGEQRVDAAGAALHFDADVLRAVDVQSSGPFDTVLLSEIDNEAGEVMHQAGKLGGPFPNGDFQLVTVRFERLAEGPTGLTVNGATALRAGADVLEAVEGLPPILPVEQNRIFLPLALN